MANLSTFETLIDLTTTEVDEAAARLGQAMRSTEDAKQKLALLMGYRDDYAARFQATMATGFTPMAYRNHQSFMAKLDLAISGQQQIVTEAEQRAERERACWREAERKRTSYRTLVSRAQKAEDQKVARREQKETDERAGRKMLHSR